MADIIVESIDKYLVDKKADDPPRVVKFGDYGKGVIKYSNQPSVSEMTRDPVKTMLEYILPACVAAKRPLVITSGFKKAADKNQKAKLNPSVEWDNANWASCCGSSIVLIIKHLQRMHVNKKIHDQVVKKLEADEISWLDRFFAMAKTEGGP